MQKVFNRALGLILVVALAALCMVPAMADRPMNTGKWYDDGMNDFIDAGYITGYGNGDYGPDRQMTRAEFMAVINKYMGFTEADTEAASKFKDLDKNRWYFNPCAIALKAGYTKGKSADTMAPNATITRQEAVTMLVAIKELELKDKDAARKSLEANEAKFVDVADVANWAVDYVEAAVEDGIVTGSKQSNGMNLAPKRNLSRAEGVYMIMHLDNEEEGIFVLMNVPYEAFYGVEADGNYKADVVDATSSATDKVGNYGLAGGGYHSGITYGTDEEGKDAAVGKANNATMQGVTWPVKVKDEETVKALGGKEITKDSKVKVAEAHHGAVGTFDLEGAAALMEAPSYSYFVLDEEPAQYMTMKVKDGKASFSANKGEVTKTDKVDVTVSYGTHWGDVQFGYKLPEEMAEIQTNAVVLVSSDGKKAGMVHLYNSWTAGSIGWFQEDVEGLVPSTITDILYYCNDTKGNYFVYDLPVEAEIAPIYEGTVTGKFSDDGKTVELTGLPSDIKNPKAVVSFTKRGQDPVYLTKTEVDPKDGDTDPVPVEVKDGKVELETAPTAGTTYSAVVTSENWAAITVSVVAPGGEQSGEESQSSGSGSGSGRSGNRS